VRKAIIHTELGQDIECVIPDDLAIQVENECIVEINKITEYGKVIRICDGDCCKNAEVDLPVVIRRATLQDQTKEKDNVLRSKMARDKCAELIKKHDLPMHLVRVWYSFERSILSLLFSADERVDFRQLMKDISSELSVRVDVRQIGVRDEAAMLGGVATCGRPMCCCSWLEKFESINVKMAKAQKLSLNPGAISGMCGRLKCCLKYEYDTYVEESKSMPREGRRVSCEDGDGVIIDRNVLAHTVKVRFDDKRISEYSIKDVSLT
jgi:cell fate regulator YaaT (PSP1 superfamily)